MLPRTTREVYKAQEHQYIITFFLMREVSVRLLWRTPYDAARAAVENGERAACETIGMCRSKVCELF